MIPMFKFLDSIFAKEKSINLTAGHFNHCPSICFISDGTLVAWYSGTGECKDDQSVHLVFINKKSQTKTSAIRIGNKTGNPVIWQTGKKTATLLYSKFENTGKIRTLVDRWKFCSIWIQKVIYDDGIRLLGNPIKIIDSTYHLLGRCNPIIYKDELLIPLYDEVNRNGVIAKIQNDSLVILGRIGQNMIQPTIWANNGVLYSLSRNFGGTKKMSQFSISLDGGRTWSRPKNSDILNFNNSLHVLKTDYGDLILWNDVMGKARRQLTLGKLSYDNGEVSAERIAVISEDNGSYPSIDYANNKLIFSFTQNKKIKYYEWNKQFFKYKYRNRSAI